MTALLACAMLCPSSGPEFDPLLEDLSRRAVQFFVEQSHPATGFTKDRARNFGQDVATNRIASIAAMGFTLPAYAIGANRGWLGRDEAVSRGRLMLKSVLEKAPRHRGWFYHWFDWGTGERVWNCEVSTIDTGIFISGLLLAERAFGDREFSQLTNKIVGGIDWQWAITRDGSKPDSKFVSHGWRPETGFIESDWKSYCELPLLYVLAYGLNPTMPAESWDLIERPEFTYKGVEFIAGGPLFMHQMAHVFFDFKNKRDNLGYDYWVNSRNAMIANRQYCIDNPKGFKGYSAAVWGLSASDGPNGYEAYGAPGNIYDNGTMAPSSAVAAAMFDLKMARNVAKATKAQFPKTMGQYGFTIAFNPTKEWMSPDVIAIDLGQMLLSIENARDGFPNRMAMKHPAVRLGLKRMGFKDDKVGPLEKRPLRKKP
jgi:hypothetical protein